MKKIKIFMMNKGGVGKTPLTIFTMLKRLKQKGDDFKIIDCDSNNHSLFNRFQGTDYEKYIAAISLLANGEESNLDFFKLQHFFEVLAESKTKEYYIDFGQDDSNALLKLIKSVGVDSLVEFFTSINLDVEICGVVAIPDNDSVKQLANIIKTFEGKLKFKVYANMLNATNDTEFIDSLTESCKINKIPITKFNEGINSDTLKSKLHEHLNLGLTTNLGLAKGKFNQIIEAIEL